MPSRDGWLDLHLALLIEKQVLTVLLSGVFWRRLAHMLISLQI